MPTILIIDDDDELFTLLDEYLKDEGFLCIHAGNGLLGLQKTQNSCFDAVILDIMLPGMNGFEVLQRIRSQETTKTIPILMLTAKGDETDKVVGLEMGADDYLAKPFSPRELVARLRALLRRSANIFTPKQTIQTFDDILIDYSALCIIIDQKISELTVTELRLLDLLLQNTGQVVKRETLYQALFGHSAYPTDRSLDMLVSRLRKKLGTRANGIERIKAVRGEGYIYLLTGDRT